MEDIAGIYINFNQPTTENSWSMVLSSRKQRDSPLSHWFFSMIKQAKDPFKIATASSLGSLQRRRRRRDGKWRWIEGEGWLTREMRGKKKCVMNKGGFFCPPLLSLLSRFGVLRFILPQNIWQTEELLYIYRVYQDSSLWVDSSSDRRANRKRWISKHPTSFNTMW